MKNLFLKNYASRLGMLLFFLLVISMSAHAGTVGNLPFNSAMDTFKTNFYAWVFVALVILWIAMCIVLAVGDWGSGIKQIITFVFWGSLALAGPAGVAALFSTGATF